MKDRKLKYTICFCIQDGRVLMIYRNFHPNLHKWNGLGGKLELDEHPTESVKREMREEAEIDLDLADTLRFSGIVTWDASAPTTHKVGGMYAYIASFSKYDILFPKRDTREGILDWKPVSFATNAANRTVVENIPKFLPPMLDNETLREYRCTYENGELKNFHIYSLAEDFRL